MLDLQSVCQMSCKEGEVVSPEQAKLGECLGWTSLSLGYGRICPHNTYGPEIYDNEKVLHNSQS